MDSDDSDDVGNHRRRKPNINGRETRNGTRAYRQSSVNGPQSSPRRKRQSEDDIESTDGDAVDDAAIGYSEEEWVTGRTSTLRGGPSAVNGSRPIPVKRKRTPDDDMDMDNHEDEGREEEDGHQQETRVLGRSTKGKERASMNGNGHANGDLESEPDDGEEDLDEMVADDDDEGEEEPQAPIQYRPEYERHPDGYVTGSVTRIKLIDFMTYDFVEFNPGPHLNMILGPNGTGKSTIAAGIAIGLGFKPEVMGRATDLKSYIKQGKEEAWTEIVLRGKPGKRNYVIWRNFTRGNKSEWQLNGQKTTRNSILELVDSFGIQANNLCCFLAQDRVAEFAKMAPPLTLRETMRAAGNPNLTKWHKGLVDKGAQKKILDEKVLSDASKRDRLQAQVNSLAPDVEHYENRQNQEFQREIMELAVEFARANDAKKLTETLKEREKELKEQVRALKAKNKPLEDLHEAHRTLKQLAADKVETKKNDLNDATRDISKSQSRLEDKLDEAGRADTELEQLRRRIKRMEADKARQLKKIEEAEELLSHPREEILGRLAEQSNRKKETQTRRRQVEQQRRELQENQHTMESDLRNIDTGINDKMRRQRELGDVEKIRIEKAIKMNGSIGYALDWLKDHAHELEHAVKLPPCISVNVPDKRYAWQIEQSLTYAQRSTFICQSRHDYDTMMRLNNRRYPPRQLSNGDRVEGGEVSLHLVFLTPTEANVNMPPPCSTEKMQSLGIDGCAIKFVDAEPPVIAYLNEQCNFSRTALTQRASIEGAQVGEAGFTAWLTKEESFRGQRSRYGRRAFQFSSMPARPAFFLNLSVDQQAIAALGAEIAELKRRKVDSEQPLQQLNEELAAVTSSLRSITAQDTEIEGVITETRQELKAHDKAKTELELAQEELQRIAERPTESAERDRLRAEKLKKALACLSNVSTLATHHATSDTLSADWVSAGLAYAQETKDVNAIETKRETGDEQMRVKGIELTTVKDKKTRSLVRYNEYYAKFMEELQGRSRPVRTEFGKRAKDPQYRDMSLNDAEAGLATLIADLEISEGINPAVIERYKRLRAELEDISKVVTAQESDLQTINKSIDTILGKFLPALDSLVDSISAKFSAAFDQQGRSGDVRLDKDERGYEFWGLVPHVSFRDNEEMQPLTGQRQSGGERSYSTIMYLMALSEMARVPFSLVDEINQGMDQDAERLVFNQLVETTCDANAGQYFLITPKLLTGLTYHERMKVLIVNNGYWLPEGTDKTQKFGDIRGCLKRFKASIAAR